MTSMVAASMVVKKYGSRYFAMISLQVANATVANVAFLLPPERKAIL